MGIDLKELVQTELYASAPDIDERLKKFDAAMLQLSPRQRDRVIFARMFRAEMKGLGITQKKLAETLGVSRALVSSWASAVSLPNEAQTEKLSEILDTNVALWARYDLPLPRDPQEAEVQSDAPDITETPSVPGIVITDDEIALIQRVRRMSQEERDALYTLLHVLR